MSKRYRVGMAKPLLIHSDHHPYHITARCSDKDFFPLPLSDVWHIMMRRLKHCSSQQSLAIHAFVLMGNHFHLLCHTPQSNIDECMHSFMRGVGLDIGRKLETQNYLWGGRYRWSLIDSQRHYYQVYRYIYQNPIRAGLVKRVEDYSFSTLKRDVPFPLHSTVPMSFGGQEGELLWLNEKYEEEDLKLIKLGLRKSQFDVDKRKFKAFSKLSIPEGY